MSAVDTQIEQDQQQPEAEAERSRQDIFKYSEWVHVGPGAADCQLAVALRDSPEAGKTEDLPPCEDPDHFHAWCRLPNPYQVRDIAEKARAARARMLRTLRDPESDGYVILEQELDALRDATYRSLLEGEILDKDFAEHYDRAVARVLDLDDPDYVPEDEDDEIPKRYAHIEADQEEYQRQIALPEEQRDETFGELEKTIAEYARLVEAELESIRKPLAEALKERDLEELIEVARKDRIDRKADEMYLHTFNTWQWYVCTYKPRKRGTPNERYFSDIARFKYETAPDVVAAVQGLFNELESRLARSQTQGNS